MLTSAERDLLTHGRRLAWLASLDDAQVRAQASVRAATRRRPVAGRDSALEEAMREAKTVQIEIKHQRPGGAEIVRHWALDDSLGFYPVTSGPVVPTVAGILPEEELPPWL